MTERLYLDSDALTGEACVVAVMPGEMRAVRLDRTLFHPRGGGQLADQGSITAASGTVIPVSDVRNADDGAVDHIVPSDAALNAGDLVRMEIKADVRQLHARLHSAGHLIALAGERVEPALRAVSGHHWPGEARVEFDGIVSNAENFEAALRTMLDEMRIANLPVTASKDGGGRRSISIDAATGVPCGGTHVANTAAIGPIDIKKMKIKVGRIRVSYDVEA